MQPFRALSAWTPPEAPRLGSPAVVDLGEVGVAEEGPDEEDEGLLGPE